MVSIEFLITSFIVCSLRRTEGSKSVPLHRRVCCEPHAAIGVLAEDDAKASCLPAIPVTISLSLWLLCRA